MRVAIFILSPALLFASSAMASNGGQMSTAEFLERAERLEQKGMLAMFSGDLKEVRRAAQAAAQAYRARIGDDRKAARALHSYPPEDEQSLRSKELLEHLRSYTEAERESKTITVAFADLMKDRYPCT